MASSSHTNMVRVKSWSGKSSKASDSVIPALPSAPQQAAHGLKKRDIEFMSHAITVLNKMSEFGNSILYVAKDDNVAVPRKSWRGTPVGERHLLIKATTASAKEEIRRAESEVKLLRKFRHNPCILKLIDCGFSTLDDDDDGDQQSSVSTVIHKRLYCMLFEPCPDYTLSVLIERQRRKRRQARPRGLLGKLGRKSDTQGYMHVATVIDVFSQMCEAIMVLHSYKKFDPRNSTNSSQEESKQHGIVHFDINPGRFLVRKLTSSSTNARGMKVHSTYEVKLCSFGCAIEGSLTIGNDAERELALQMLGSMTTDIYRAPEMVNFELCRNQTLTDRCDIWSLGCCFYAMLFLRDCFKDSSHIAIMNGKYIIPQGHPFDFRFIDLLDRMLTVAPEARADITEVIACLDAIQEGTPFPVRRILTMQMTGTARVSGGSKEFSRVPMTIDVDSRSALEYQEGLDRDTTISSSFAGSSAAESSSAADSSEMGGSLQDSSNKDDIASTDDDAQWLEFQPGQPNNTARLKSGTFETATKPKRRQNSKGDPLSLGVTGGNRRKKRETDKSKTDWDMGVFNRISTKSLNPIEQESDDDDQADENGFIVVKVPSNRTINHKPTSTNRSDRSISPAAAVLLGAQSHNQEGSHLKSSETFTKDRASSPTTVGYNGDKSSWDMDVTAWGVDSSVQHESANFSSSDTNDNVLPCSDLGIAPTLLPLPGDSPDSVLVPTSLLRQTLPSELDTIAPIQVPSLQSLDSSIPFFDSNELDGNDSNCVISKSASKNGKYTNDEPSSISSILNQASLHRINGERHCSKLELHALENNHVNDSNQDIDIPLPEDFPLVTSDGSNSPLVQGDNEAVDQINPDMLSYTSGTDQGLAKVSNSSLSKLKSEKVDIMSEKKRGLSPQIKTTEILGQTPNTSDCPEENQITVSMNINTDGEASDGSKSTWDDFFGGGMDDSLDASKDTSNELSRFSVKHETKSTDTQELGGRFDELNTGLLSQRVERQCSVREPESKISTIMSKNVMDGVVDEAERIKVGHSRKSDIKPIPMDTHNEPIDLLEIKKWVKDTTGKSTYGSDSKGERPPELTPVEEPTFKMDSFLCDTSHFPASGIKGSLDSFLERENALAEYQELVRYTTGKKEPVMECKVSVGNNENKELVVHTDAQRRYPSASGAPLFLPKHEKPKAGNEARANFAANDLMRFKNGLQSASHRLVHSDIGQVLIPTEEEHDIEPQQRGIAEALEPSTYPYPIVTDATAKWVFTVERVDSIVTVDSNLPPAEEACVAEVSRPTDSEIARVPRVIDTFPTALDLASAPQSEFSKSERLARRRFELSKNRMTDDQPFPKLFAPRNSSPTAKAAQRFDDHLLGPEPYYSDDSDYMNDIPFEIEIIPDNALSSVSRSHDSRSPKAKKKKSKGKKVKRKGSKDPSTFIDNDYFLNHPVMHDRVNPGHDDVSTPQSPKPKHHSIHSRTARRK